MGRHKCPICGDPQAYLFWAGAEPPDACVDDVSWHAGGTRTIQSVTQCETQMRRAAQAAERRRLVPDAFDENGNMLPGQSARVLLAYAQAHPEKGLLL